MPLHLGVDGAQIYVGDTLASKVYVGEDEAWSAGSDPVPVTEVGSPVTHNSAASNISTGGVNLSITPTAGNTVVVFAYFRGSTSTTCTITPTGGSATFTSRVAQLGGSTYLHILTAHNVGAGITSINVAPNVGARGMVWVQEYAGVDSSTPMDVTAVGSAPGSGATKTSTLITPVTSGTMVIAGFGHNGNSSTSSPYKATTAGPSAAGGSQSGVGWTDEFDLWSNTGSTSHNMVIASNLVNTVGDYQAQWTTAVTTAAAHGTIALRPAA